MGSGGIIFGMSFMGWSLSLVCGNERTHSNQIFKTLTK